MKYLYLLILFIIVSTCNGQGQLLSKANDLISSIRFVRTGSLIYDRGIFGSDEFEDFYRSLNQNKIEKLLENTNGKIKALGILALYNSYDQRNISLIAKYISDTTNCFVLDPVSPFASNPQWNRKNEMLSKSKTLTVGDISNEIIQFYCRQSGYNIYGYDGFEQWINKRKSKRVTAGYLKVLKLKATGGSTPFNEMRQNKIDKLKLFIDNIDNQNDRVTYKLYLSSTGHQMYSDDELLDELQKLSIDEVKNILSRTPQTSDLDLLDVNGEDYSSFYYLGMCKWILMNSAIIFSKEDIPYILSRAEHEFDNYRNYGTNLNFIYWYVAAARLDRDGGAAYIKQAVNIFKNKYQDFERAELYAELLHLSGRDSDDFILNWIFDTYKINEESYERIDVFIGHLNVNDDFKFIKKWIHDDRFKDSSKVQTIIMLAELINESNSGNSISNNLIEDIYHPYWISQFERDKRKAMIEYPLETVQLLEDVQHLLNELKRIK